MTKEQAIEQMKNGKKVTHRYFTSEEFITMVGNKIVSEDGVIHGMPSDFFSIRKGIEWTTDWEIFVAP